MRTHENAECAGTHGNAEAQNTWERRARGNTREHTGRNILIIIDAKSKRNLKFCLREDLERTMVERRGCLGLKERRGDEHICDRLRQAGSKGALEAERGKKRRKEMGLSYGDTMVGRGGASFSVCGETMGRKRRSGRGGPFQLLNNHARTISLCWYSQIHLLICLVSFLFFSLFSFVIPEYKVKSVL